MASVPFNNLITFSRGSNATVTGPTGLVQWAPNNLLTFSEQFDNAVWTKGGVSTAANSTTAPDGTTTADTLTEDTSTGDHRTFQNISVSNATPYTFSVYVKPNGRTLVNLTFAGVAEATYNISTGVVTNTALGTAEIQPAGNGWYRCVIKFTSATTAYNAQIRLVSTGTTTSYTGNGVSGVYLWGAQLELGSAATTYNSTTVKNLLGFSEAFDNAAWTKVAASIVTGAQANPVNGAFNAQKLMENTAAGVYHYARQQLTVAGTAQTFSIYVKAAERTRAVISITDLTTGDASVGVDLTNGTTFSSGLAVGSWTNISSSVLPVGNGWYRVSLTATRGAGTQSAPVVAPVIAAGSTSYTGDGNSGVYIYGAQLSDSASLDPYVPTPAAAPSSTAYYGPRFDYDPVTLQPKGLLVEEARTNLATYSEQFDNAAWVKTNATVTANATTSPDGTTNADKLAETATTASFVTAQVPTMALSTTYTLSAYMKAGERSFGVMNIFTGAASCWTWFNLATGAVSTLGAGATATITNANNGWYRCTLTIATAASGTPNVALYPAATNGVLSYAGTAGSGIFVYGAQLEAGAFATSYIPTVASTVTRSADVATISGSLFSQWYGQSEGTFVVEATVPTDVDGGSGNFYLAASDSTIANQIILADVSGTVGQISTGGVLQFNNGVGAEPTGVLKAAIAFQTNNTIICAGGTLGTLDTSVTLPSVNRLLIGIRGDSNSTTLLNGHIRSINYIPARAADFQLQALTL